MQNDSKNLKIMAVFEPDKAIRLVLQRAEENVLTLRMIAEALDLHFKTVENHVIELVKQNKITKRTIGGVYIYSSK